MDIIYDMIHDLANKTWHSGEVTKYNFEQWAEHWISCANQIRNDFSEQGLIRTAEECDKIIGYSQATLDRERAKPKGRNNKPILRVQLTTSNKGGSNAQSFGIRRPQVQARSPRAHPRR